MTTVKYSINFFLLFFSYSLFAQASILKNSVPNDLHQYTLLVERFKHINPNDDYFKSGDVDAKKEKKFIEKYNRKISQNNLKLDKIFTKFYKHDYVLSNFDSKLDTINYPYMFSRTLILASKFNVKNEEKGFFSFAHNIKNRKQDKSLRDINLYSRRYWHNVKIIILEMNDYLEGRD